MKQNNYLDHFSHQVNLYLDNELSKEDEKHVLQRADSDPHCCGLLNNEASFRDLIKYNIKRSIASVELIDNIKSKVRK
ncbi:MAG: hypothetical protein V3V00_15285 [Saprospiraceae bacterium]